MYERVFRDTFSSKNSGYPTTHLHFVFKTEAEFDDKEEKKKKRNLRTRQPK